MNRIINRKKEINAGIVKDIEIYPIYQNSRRKSARAAKTKLSREAQQKLNDKNAKKKLFYILNANFDENDHHITLSYDESNLPPDEKSAEHDGELFLRRLRRASQKHGFNYKYIAVVELGVENGRLHHHIVAKTGLAAEVIKKMWKYGYCNADRLEIREDVLKGLTNYLVKAPKGKKRWRYSKNLNRPYLRPEISDNRTSRKTVRNIILHQNDKEWFAQQFPGFELVNCEIKKNEYIRGSYVYLRLRKKREIDKERRRRTA